jgi:hypothetical protein
MIDPQAHRLTELSAIRERIGGEPHPAIPKKISDSLDEKAIAYIAQSPFMLLATSDAQGIPDVSPKGDAPGFVWVENASTLWIPDRPGNKLVMGFQNLLANPRAAGLFMIPGTEETLRVSGRTTIHDHPQVLERLSWQGRPAQLAMRMAVEECFFHCAKAFKRSHLWQPGSWPAPFRVSFGEILAARLGGGEEMKKDFDAAVEQDYRENI